MSTAQQFYESATGMEPGQPIYDASGNLSGSRYSGGCLIRHTQDGVAIYMKHAQPGYFYNDFGGEVSPELARAAGYDVDPLVAMRKKMARIAVATQAIEEEFNAPSETVKIVKEVNGFKVVDVGNDRFNLLDPEGNRLNKQFMTREVAVKTLDSVTKAEAKA